METITEGYVAFNGHVFTKTEAELYMAECQRCEAYPTQFNLDCRHRTFCLIIGLYDDKTTQDNA